MARRRKKKRTTGYIHSCAVALGRKGGKARARKGKRRR